MLKNKEDILKSAQKEPFSAKEYDNHIFANSTIFGTFVAIAVGAILFLVELLKKNTWNFGLLALASTVIGAQLLFEGIRLKSTWKIIVGSIEALIALFFVIAFIWQVAI